MPLPRVCLPFSTPEHTADPSSSLRSLTLTASSSASSSSASSEAAMSSDDSASILTFPSLPSLQSLIPSSSSSSFSASFAHLTSLQPVGPSSGSVAAAALAVSPASLLLYCATPSEISIYDLRTLRRIETVAGAAPSAGAVKSVALLPDGRRALTAHQDGRIRVWRRSRRSGRLRLDAALPTVPDRIRRLPLPGSYVRVRRHRRRLWIEHADAVSAVAAAAAGDLLYSASWDKTLKIWRADDLRCVESLKAHDDAVNAVAVAPDGTIYTGSADGRIRVWAREELRHALVATMERHASAVNALAIGGEGAVLYSGSNDRSILVWEKEECGEHMAVAGALRGHEKAVLCIACVGNVVFSGSADRTVRIWRRGGREGREYGCLGVLAGHSSAVRSIAAVRMPEEEEKAAEEEEEYRVCGGSLDGEVRVSLIRVSARKESDPT